MNKRKLLKHLCALQNNELFDELTTLGRCRDRDYEKVNALFLLFEKANRRWNFLNNKKYITVYDRVIDKMEEFYCIQSEIEAAENYALSQAEPGSELYKDLVGFYLDGV